MSEGLLAAEAVDFLAGLGVTVPVSALYRMRSEGKGPESHGGGVRGDPVKWDRDSLAAYARDQGGSPNGGGGNGNGGDTARHVHATLVESTTGNLPARRGLTDEQREIVREHLALSDKLVNGGGTFADGVAYARSLEKLRKLARG